MLVRLDVNGNLIWTDATQILYITAFNWNNNSACAVSTIRIDAGDAPITFTEQIVCQKWIVFLNLL
jgi:hypothetical protein